MDGLLKKTRVASQYEKLFGKSSAGKRPEPGTGTAAQDYGLDVDLFHIGGIGIANGIKKHRHIWAIGPWYEF